MTASRAAGDAARPLRVLEAVHAPDGTTRYVDQVVSKAPPWVTFSYLGARRLVELRYDVLHVHWPDALLRGRCHRLRCIGLVGLLAVLRRRGVAIVRTLHNLDPHEGGSRFEAWATRRLDRATTYFVTINPVTPVPLGRGVYIPHGHYRDRFADLPRRTPVAGRLMYAGLIRPYKGVDRLLDAFRAVDDASLTLRLVGRPTRELRAAIEQAQAADARISSRLAFVADAELVAEMTAAELVCLPYRELHNSGVLLVALSLDRPVLVPRTPTTEALADEVGPGWIHCFDGALDADALQGALTRVRRETRAARPTLDGRDWTVVGRAYAEAFVAAAHIAQREAGAANAAARRGGAG